MKESKLGSVYFCRLKVWTSNVRDLLLAAQDLSKPAEPSSKAEFHHSSAHHPTSILHGSFKRSLPPPPCTHAHLFPFPLPPLSISPKELPYLYKFQDILSSGM